MADTNNRLTDTTIKNAAKRDERYMLSDGRGLFLVVHPTGSKTWLCATRIRGRTTPVKITLGSYPGLGLAAARRRRDAARTAAEEGKRLPGPRAPLRAEAAPEGTTVGQAWDEYVTVRLTPDCRASTIAEHKRVFDQQIGPARGTDGRALRDRDIKSIVKGDLLQIVDDAGERGPAARNKCVAVLTSFLGKWAHEDRGYIANPPTAGIRQKRASKERRNRNRRVLADPEITTFWSACDAIDSDGQSSIRFGAMFKLLLLTGCRRNEIAGIPDSEIDLNAKVWTLPGERTKNGHPLKVHLTGTELAILKGIPRIDGCDYVFGEAGETCAFSFSKAKARLDKVMKPKRAFRLHDLRRTFRTGIGRLGVLEGIAERCINHLPDELVDTYDTGEYDVPMAEAWDKWDRHVRKIASAKPA
ncbi:integrase [Bradyrhizobium sp. RT6a]|uniref:tyrosine-type recombinase/integrase n=1 Tax=Bradyrhizobium sp. RT6a TaxID=3156381 RepID=UPI003391B340